MILREREQKHLKELEGCAAELEQKRAKSAKLRTKFKVRIKEVL